MDIQIKTNTETKFEATFPDTDHTFCNALKDKLNQTESVKVATYAIKHPLVGQPEFLVETDSKTTPLKALQKAAKDLKSDFQKLEKSAKKELA